MKREDFIKECQGLAQKNKPNNSRLLENVLAAAERSFSRTESDMAENYGKLALMIQGCKISGNNIEDTYQAAIKHLDLTEFEKGMFSILIALEIES